MEIILNNVKKTIKKATVIDGISAKWTGGKVYGLCGYNGCGKTMLMRLVAGLIRPTEGSVTIDGKELGFLDHYTAMQNLQLVASLKKKATREDCIDALKRVNLDPNDLRTFKKFSLGMKQRLGIAAAIFEKPDLILLDEPTNALDADGTELAAKIIREERERGALIMPAMNANFWRMPLMRSSRLNTVNLWKMKMKRRMKNDVNGMGRKNEPQMV